MTLRTRAALLFAGVCVIALPRVVQTQQPEPFQNLQVLPKDIPRDSLIRIMRGFAMALGVRCDFCHVEREAGSPPPAAGGGGIPPLNYKSDDKDEKKNARFMLKMVRDINTNQLANMPRRNDPPVNVQCVTCHRGLTRPTTLGVLLASTVQRAGVDSAVAQYRALRQSDAMTGRYDFSEVTVNDVAQGLAASGKGDEALALLRMNQEFYPNSGQIDMVMGEIYRQRGDKEKAIVAYRAALLKQPQNRQARARLTELGVTP